MEIQNRKSDNQGEFFIKRDGNTLAELPYSISDNTHMIIHHTEVSEELRGQKVGKKMVEHAVNYARENDLKIISHCSYAKKVIERDESMRDILG